jgi:class 3 adenylate cyclase/predicted ATPase
MSDRLKRWLEEIGLGEHAQAFAENHIDFDLLPRLSTEDLKELGLSIGHRRRFLDALTSFEETPSAVGRVSRHSATQGEAERRQLTVMFCDLVGSTELSQTLDPEDLRELNRAYQDCCKAAIERYDGYVARYMGDGVLSYFGYPQAHEDDAERAIHAGLELIAAVHGLSTGIDSGAGVKLSTRVGIATGPVVVGDLIGEGASLEVAVVGETPNLASRLEALAEPNTVVIGPGTHKLAAGRFDYENLGPHELKGIAKPVNARRVVAPVALESRFEASHRSALTSLVGREREIALLLDRWEQAKRGEGQIVLVSGEAGVGKSRIIETLRERTTLDEPTRLRYQCSPHHVNSAFRPIIEHIERVARFDRQDCPSVKLDKLESMLAPSTQSVEVVAPLLAALLSIPTEGRYSPIEMTPERQKQETLETLLAQLLELARQRPVILVFEDVHWADPTSLELLALIVEHAEGARVQVVITFRPEFTVPWVSPPYTTSLDLNRFGRRLVVAMVAKVTGGKPLPDEVFERIFEKTDGVPLFVEELTKTIVELDMVEDRGDHYALNAPLSHLTIPSTLQDSLMARLDRLGRAKEVAQTAAVIGREFTHEILLAASRSTENQLRAAVTQLIDSGLVFRRGNERQGRYVFKHGLVRDAAYESLLRSKRRIFHARVARVLETQFPERAEAQPELLAHHYTGAGMAIEAIGYWLRAGHRAAERSANLEAVGHLRKGLDVVATMAGNGEGQQYELEFLVALGGPLIATRGPGDPEVETTYKRALSLCERLPPSENHFKAHWGWWRVSMDLQIGRSRADKLLELARALKEPGLLLQAHHCLWATTFHMGEHRACSDHIQAGLELYDEEQHREHASIYGDHDARVCGYGEQGLSLWMRGHPDQAVERVKDACAWARQLSHIGSLAHAKSYDLILSMYRRETSAVRSLAEDLIDFATEQGLPEYLARGQFLRGWTAAQSGAVERGLDEMAQGIASLERVGTKEDFPTFFVLMADVCQTVGSVEHGIGHIEAAFAVSGEVDHFWLAELHRRKGELLLSTGGAKEHEAESHLQLALDTARRQGAKSLELRAATSLARHWWSKGRREDGRQLIGPLYDWFTEGFDTSDLQEAKSLLHLGADMHGFCVATLANRMTIGCELGLESAHLRLQSASPSLNQRFLRLTGPF